MLKYVVISLILIALVALFAAQNSHSVDINLIFKSIKAPLILTILFSFFLGCLVGFVTMLIYNLRYQRLIKNYQDKVKSLEAQQLQKLPPEEPTIKEEKPTT